MRDKSEVIAELKRQAKKERENKKILIFDTSDKFQRLLQELGDLEASCCTSLDDLTEYLEQLDEESKDPFIEILDTVIGGGGV